MFNIFSKTEKEPSGYIALFNLKDWWRDSFTDDERKHIVEVFQPLGASKDVLIVGELQSSGNKRILSFLSSLAGWFDNPRDRHIAHKIIVKAADYVASEKNILDLHFFYPQKMKLFYKERENPSALKEATDACLKQIEISEKAAAAFRKEYSDSQLPAHEGYGQLCIILEKQEKFEEAIKFAEQAKKQGWSGDWDGRVERCKKKHEKSLKNRYNANYMALLSFIKSLVSEKEGVKEYREKLAHFLSDSKISAEEKGELESISKKFALTPDEIGKLQKSALSGVFQNITSDQRITEEERQSLEVLLNHFGLQTKDIKFDQKSFNKFYSLALIDKGILPEIKEGNHDINIIFKKGEVLHFGAASVLRKLKRVTTRINYGGFTGSIKIMKGVRYRVGSLGIGTESKEVLASEDNGIFYITNQNVGYIGSRKQFSVPFGKVHSFELRPEGMYIFKQGKETPHIITLDDYEVPSAMISFILNKE